MLKIFDEIHKEIGPELQDYAPSEIKEIALDLIEYELVNGAIINNWRYYKEHKMMEGPCLFNGEKFVSIQNKYQAAYFLVNTYSDLWGQYIEKLKNQIKNREYDIIFFEPYLKKNSLPTFIMFCRKYYYFTPILLFIAVSLIDIFIQEFFKKPYVFVGMGSILGGNDLILTFSITFMLLIFISFIYLLLYLAQKSIKEENDLWTWVKKIILMYIIITLNYSIMYTQIYFISNYMETIKTLDYYIPEEVTGTDTQTEFIDSVNKYIIEHKNIQNEYGFSGPINSIKLFYIDTISLDNESITNLKKSGLLNVQGNKTYVINIDYKTYFLAYSDMLYYSIIAITTGFGDTYPNSFISKLLTISEIIIGQFFIIIAIGKAFSNGDKKHNENKKVKLRIPKKRMK